MSALSLTQALRRCLFFSTVGFVLFINEATACQVHPSEYAYEVNSVTEQESISANCRRYTNVDGLPQGVDSTDYIHCDGAQLKLADNNLGSEQSFSSISHYQWPARSTAQLLFIFPTRVSLTSITLHYYCDSLTGLPRLIFYAVRNDFDVWDSPTLNTPHVDVDVASVPLGEEPAGRKSASINVNFSTKKVLMYKFRSVFKLAMSEVEFFTCHPTTNTAAASTTTTTGTITNLTFPSAATTAIEGPFELTEDESHSTLALPSNKLMQCQHGLNPRDIVAWVLVVILVVLLSVSLTINGILAVREYRKRNKLNDPSPVAMDSNPCYEASTVKQTEADQEAVHVYEMVKQHD